jgi:excisionase family DNA binding protein
VDASRGGTCHARGVRLRAALVPAGCELEILTPAQLSGLLQVDEDVVVELAETGELPGRRVGEEWRFSREAILAWLAADE